MIKPALLPRLTKTRGCFLDLPPSDIKPADLPHYEAVYRQQYGALFHHRDGYRFWFVLPTQKARDQFLTALEKSYEQLGIPTRRSVS